MRISWVFLLVGCTSSEPAGVTPDAAIAGVSGCTLAAATVATGRTAPSGCAIVDRDTSACDVERVAAGIPAIYRHFSCRVTLSRTSSGVVAVSDGRPDFTSNYFAASDPCWESYTGAIQNPNQIAKQSYSITFPLAPNTTSRTMQMTAIVGLVIDGVPVFGNFAAPGDDIFQEAKTFDRCGGHPQMNGIYHNHAEPLSVTYDDSRFVGMMRDGYPIYGRRDADDTYPTLDSFGGHTGTTPDSPSTAVYHYHVNQQTSTASASYGEQQWFLTKGTFRGTPGACTGC